MTRPEEKLAADQADQADRTRAMVSVLEDLQAERKRLAEEIDQRRRTEKFARAVIDSALDAVISMDCNGRIVEWNAQAENIFGWKRSEALGQELAFLIIPPQHREAYLAGLEHYKKTGEAPVLGQRLELSALRKSGEEFPVEFSVVAVQFDEAVLFNAFLRDITQRSKDAEYRMRMAALVDSSYDAIIGKDIDGTIISWNAGAERVYGYREEEAVDKTIGIILPHACEQEERQILHALQTGQRLEQFETIRRRKDGSLIPVSLNLSPIADERGQIIGSSTIERDITDRKQAEVAEAEHNRMLALRVDISTALAANQSLGSALQQCTQSLVQHLDVAFARIWTLNEQSNVLELLASAGLYTHLDGAHSRIKMGDYKIGRIALNRQPHLSNDVPNDPNISSPQWAKREGMVAFAGYPLMIGEHVLGVVAMFARRKLTKTILSHLVPLADGIAQYIERKRSEDELRRAKEEAEQAVRMRAEFLANVSHELRTPMNAIIGMTQIALAEELSEEVRDCIQTANDSAHSLLKLLNDILDFSKVESGKFTLDSEPFNLREALDETVKTLSSRAMEKELKLVCEVAEEAPCNLMGDALRIQQVLTNLIANAIKFTEQGEVDLSVEMLRSWPRGARLRFSVRDTGIGISQENRQRILEPFTQADASSTRRHGGTGLGLAICSELLDLMGSHLSVESELGQGSCFSFELTLARPVEGAQKFAGATPPDGSDEKMRAKPLVHPGQVSLSILLAEDTPANQKVVKSILKRRGHAVTIAQNGQQAVELFQSQAFDAVLMDVQMPIMDGFQATAAIRQHERNSTKSTPIIAMTAHAMPGDREKCLKADMDAYIDKPIDVKRLVELVENVANSRSAAQSPSKEAVSKSYDATEPCCENRLSDESQASRAEAGVIDFEGAMQRLAGDMELFRELICYFDEDSPKLLLVLREAIAHADASSVRRAAHSLKGLAANFGAQACIDAAQAMETLGGAGNLKDAPDLLSLLELELGRLDNALAEYRK